MDLSKLAIGDAVVATYIPYPYLGTGVVDVKTVEGKFAGTRMFKGRTYVIIEDATGKVIIEKDVMDFQTIVKKVSTPPQGESKMTPPNYNVRH